MADEASVDPRLAEISQAQQQVRSQVAAGQLPTEITLRTGEVFKAESPELLMQKLAEGKAAATEHIHRIESENAELRKYQQQIQAAMAPQQTQTGDGFDKARYYDMLASDPVQANEYLLSHTPSWKRTQEQSEVAQLERSVGLFLNRNQDFSGTQEDSDKLTNLVFNLGFPTTLDGLEAAYALGVRRGEFKPIETQQPASLLPPPNAPTIATNIDSASAQLAEQIRNASSEREAEQLMRNAGLKP